VQANAAAVVPPAAPGIGQLAASFEFDRVMGTLRFDVNLTGVAAGDALAVTLHRGAAGENGPVLQRLMGPGAVKGAGTIQLTPRDRQELSEGRLYLQIYTRARPLGAARAQLTP
jgi:hypothetical protein